MADSTGNDFSEVTVCQSEESEALKNLAQYDMDEDSDHDDGTGMRSDYAAIATTPHGAVNETQPQNAAAIDAKSDKNATEIQLQGSDEIINTSLCNVTMDKSLDSDTRGEQTHPMTDKLLLDTEAKPPALSSSLKRQAGYDTSEPQKKKYASPAVPSSLIYPTGNGGSDCNTSSSFGPPTLPQELLGKSANSEPTQSLDAANTGAPSGSLISASAILGFHSVSTSDPESQSLSQNENAQPGISSSSTSKKSGGSMISASSIASFHSGLSVEELRQREEEYRKQVEMSRGGKASSDSFSTTNKGTTTKSKLYTHGSSGPPPPPKALIHGHGGASSGGPLATGRGSSPMVTPPQGGSANISPLMLLDCESPAQGTFAAQKRFSNMKPSNQSWDATLTPYDVHEAPRELTGKGDFNVGGFLADLRRGSNSDTMQSDMSQQRNPEGPHFASPPLNQNSKNTKKNKAGFRSNLHNNISEEARRKAEEEYKQRIAMSRGSSIPSLFSTTNKGTSTKSKLYTNTGGKPPPPPKALMGIKAEPSDVIMNRNTSTFGSKGNTQAFGSGKVQPFGSGKNSTRPVGSGNRNNSQAFGSGKSGSIHASGFGNSRMGQQNDIGEYNTNMADFGNSGSMQTSTKTFGFGQQSNQPAMNIPTPPHQNQSNDRNIIKKNKKSGFRSNLHNNVSEEERRRAEEEYRRQIALSRGSSTDATFSTTNKGTSTKSKLYTNTGGKPPPPPKALVAGGGNVQSRGGNMDNSQGFRAPKNTQASDFSESYTPQQVGDWNSPSMGSRGNSKAFGAARNTHTFNSGESYASQKAGSWNSPAIGQQSDMSYPSQYQAARIDKPPNIITSHLSSLPHTQPQSQKQTPKTFKSSAKGKPGFRSEIYNALSADRRQQIEAEYKKQIEMSRGGGAGSSGFSTTNKGTTTKSKLYNNASGGPPPPPKAIVQQRQ